MEILTHRDTPDRFINEFINIGVEVCRWDRNTWSAWLIRCVEFPRSNMSRSIQDMSTPSGENVDIRAFWTAMYRVVRFWENREGTEWSLLQRTWIICSFDVRCPEWHSISLSKDSEGMNVHSSNSLANIKRAEGLIESSDTQMWRSMTIESVWHVRDFFHLFWIFASTTRMSRRQDKYEQVESHPHNYKPSVSLDASRFDVRKGRLARAMYQDLTTISIAARTM